MNAKRGYFAIPIGEETLEGHFSMSFLYSMCQLKGCELSEVHKHLSNTLDPKSFCEILVAAHDVFCKRENQKPKFNNVTLLLDEMFDLGLFQNQEIITTVQKALFESTLFGNDENINTGLKRNIKKSTKDPK